MAVEPTLDLTHLLFLFFPVDSDKPIQYFAASLIGAATRQNNGHRKKTKMRLTQIVADGRMARRREHNNFGFLAMAKGKKTVLTE